MFFSCAPAIPAAVRWPKDIDSLGNMEFDYVVTLCDNARESCPFFPAKTKRIKSTISIKIFWNPFITAKQEVFHALFFKRG
jgi:hypothetical protein